MAKVDPTTSIGVGVCARGRIGFVNKAITQKDGRMLYKGFDLFGNPWQTICLKPVSWAEVIKKLKWRLSQ